MEHYGESTAECYICLCQEPYFIFKLIINCISCTGRVSVLKYYLAIKSLWYSSLFSMEQTVEGVEY